MRNIHSDECIFIIEGNDGIGEVMGCARATFPFQNEMDDKMQSKSLERCAPTKAYHFNELH